ncbi:pimeloyl-ACP methyl ester carboxylesterase [Bradyrhizobium sp. AZCC 1719]|uniref:alpha/beta fold hydrolase n=1 Tax=Bradyrhizobium sp. AZCC 1719 TaxID=3117028 RepID=UPI002FF3D66F
MDIGRRNAFKTLAGATLAAATAPRALARSGEIESRIARLNGCDIHYRVAGSGPTVVLLHGWPQTSFAWLGVMHRLADRYRLIAPDIRGTGLSEKTVSGYDKRTIAEDVRQLIQLEADGRAHLVGHDMGGKAALVLALLAPESVSRLVLVDCSVPGTENMDPSRGGLWHYGFHMAPEIPELLTKGRERDYIAAQIKSWCHRKDAVTDEAISEYASHYAKPGGMTAGFNLYRALKTDAALVASLSDRRLVMPVMTIGGRHSVGDKLAQQVAPRCDRHVGVVIEDSGHFVAEEAESTFCDHIVRFLSA